MSRTQLITFLGRAPKGEDGYRRTRYDFGDGTSVEEAAFFGWVLKRRLRPERLVVLGTSGSMWDHLFEGDLDLGDAGEQERMALIDAVGSRAVTQAQLDRMAPLLEPALGTAVRLRIIPYCRTREEQVELLRILASEVQEDDDVHLDISHGFRHIPMLALLAALHIGQIRRARVHGIWYGSFDSDTGQAPVHELSGLLQIADWLQALNGFDKDGDYGVFVPLLRGAGLSDPGCDALREAAYFENVLNVGEATGRLKKALDELRAHEQAVAPEAALLLPVIHERLNWVAERKQFEKQVALAHHALARNDYLRATLYAFEACMTRLCQLARVDINNSEAREQLRNAYGEWLKKNGPERERDAYNMLRMVRNQVAHGTRGSTGDIQRILLNESKMRRFLEDIIDAIDNNRLPCADTVADMPA